MALTLSNRTNTHATLAIQVLGRFELRLDGRPIDLPSRKPRALLGYLVLNETCEASRERLVGLLWSSSDSEHARGSLRQCLREIRAAIPESAFGGFEADRLAITLDRSRLDVDLWTVLDQAKKGRAPERLLDGSGLLEDMLHDLDSVDPEFSSWLTAKRKTLQEKILRQLETQLRRDVQEEEDSLRVARVMLNLDATHEEACRTIMRTLAARGDTTGAQRVYKQLWDVLDKDFDSEPDPKTVELIAQIKAGTPLTGDAGWAAVNRASDPAPAKTARQATLPRTLKGQGLLPARPPEVPAAQQPFQIPPAIPGATNQPQRAGQTKLVLSIAPFALSGPDGSTAHVLQGFRRELIASLVRFREWVVREPVSLLAPRDSNAGEYILEAGGTHVGETISLSLTLKEVATREFLWSQTLDLNLENLFSTQRELVRRIASKLNVHVSAGRMAQIAPQANENLRAYDVWLRGQANMMTFDPLRWQEADQLFRSVIERHPDFGPAYSSLAQLQNTIHFVHPGVMRSSGRAAEALKYARTATRLDPSDSRAQLSLGWAYAMSGYNDQATTHHTLAYELNDNDPWTLVSAALGFAFRGDCSRASKLAEIALNNSMTPAPAQWRYQAMIRYMCKDYEGCLQAAKEAEQSIANVLVWKAAALSHLGREQEARIAAKQFFQAVGRRWFNIEPATPKSMARWFLGAFPIANKCDWQRLRDDFAIAGAPTNGIRYNELDAAS